MTDKPTNNPTGDPTDNRRDLAGMPDLPLIVEQLLDQLDDLQQAIESQQRLISILTSRVTALEQANRHD